MMAKLTQFVKFKNKIKFKIKKKKRITKPLPAGTYPISFLL